MPAYPLVTIITPSFNQGQFIEATIKSVLGQTYRDIEYIVIDGMSTDQTQEVLERYSDRIKDIVREPDKGQSDAIVKGFKRSKGELVGWINSDDILYPDCVERIVEVYRQNPTTVLFYDSEIDIISESGDLVRAESVPRISRDRLLRKRATLIQPGSFYRRDALIGVGYLDTGLRYSMDLDLWLRLLSVGDCIDLGKPPVAAYRAWSGTKTSSGSTRLVEERIALLERHGARSFDTSILNLKLVRIKFRLKAALKGIAKPMSKFSFVQATCLILYYGLFRYLPASSSRYTRWTRFLRRIVCTPLFRFAGANINVERGAAFGTGRKVSVGNNSGIGINCQIFGEISIGNWVMMGPDVMFITTSHRFDQTDKPMYAQGISGEKKIVINDDVWIGARCIFLPGVSVGQGSVIGAGSVVTKNIPEFSIAAGNPARVLKSRH